jgi:hypothetical protein
MATQCCTLYCDPMALTCSAAGQCTQTGGGCMYNAQCCSNQCTAGTCQGSGGCSTLGESCSNCCSGTCLGGRCFFYNYCRAGGDLCAQNSDCCDGVCDPSTHRCDSQTQCVLTNEPCTGLRSCCDTLCVADNFGSSYCYPMCGCRAVNDVCTSDKQCCTGSCGAPDSLGLKRCNKMGPLTGGANCLADGDVCGGLGASQNCCNGGKSSCRKTSDGVSRCFPTGGGACFAAGVACSLCDQCCSHLCLPNAGSTTGFSCGSMCIPLGSGTCTVDTDCCAGAVCQGGICVTSGETCIGLGGPCMQTSDCCFGACTSNTCQ